MLYRNDLLQAQVFEARIGSPTKILVLEVHEEVLKGRLKARKQHHKVRNVTAQPMGSVNMVIKG